MFNSTSPADVNTLFTNKDNATKYTPDAKAIEDVSKNGMAAALGTFDDQELLDLWTKIRRECIDQRLVFHRQWHRNILYVLGRQWIEYHANAQGWRDKRLAQWVPRPVTNKCKEIVQAIRAFFTSVQLGVNVRPNGTDPKNVAAASTADDLAPVLHDVHEMNDVLNEFDFWLLTCGNAFFYTFVDYDMKHGLLSDPSEVCMSCQAEAKSSEIAAAGNKCPQCGINAGFMPATDEQGQPVLNQKPKPQPMTVALSPLEIAFSNSYQRFKDLPYVVRLRWRTKAYYEAHPQLRKLVDQIRWEKTSGDLPMQLFRSLSQHNDLGLAPQYLMGSELSGSDREDGITEFEIHYKPCDAYPDGLVFRVVGEKESGQILHLEDTEAIPGPLPYTDAEGKPLFTFSHATYEHVGGRILGSGPVDLIIQKQDQLNQLDSMILLTINRTANPVWTWPKGSNPGKINGMPGLCIEWDSLTVGGNAKPERIPGIGPDASLFKIREQYLADIDELAGTFDIMKGAKPSGVEAFSALQLLDERSKGRFTPVLQARAEAYKDWYKSAIELEREFGPDQRTKATQLSARSWTFQNFKRTALAGSVNVIVESGSTAPKTSLGMRAALDHAKQMGLVDFTNPDTSYEALKLMGLSRMVPSLDINIQSALQKQQAFEEWAVNPTAMNQSMTQAQQATVQFMQQAAQKMQAFQQQTAIMAAQTPPLGQPAQPQAPPDLGKPPSVLDFTPLKWLSWYSAPIHMQEFLKWANSDSVRDLLSQNAQLAALLTQHQQEIQQNIPPAMAQPPKVNFTFNGQDLVDPQVRQFLDKVEGLPPGDPNGARPRTGAGGGNGQSERPPSGGGAAMRNSNRESTQGNEPSGSGEGAQKHGAA